MRTFPTLYKKDSKGKIRIWFMEVDGSMYRATSGLQDGKITVGNWSQAKPKNVGRANATTAEEQAVSEVESQYTKKLDTDYHESIEDVDNRKFFDPMLATKWPQRRKKIKWGNDAVRAQTKLDGIRCLATKTGLWSRTGHRIFACPHIEEELAPFFEKYPDYILDGELYNHKFKKNFNKIVSIVRKTKPTEEDIAEAAALAEYHIYDIGEGFTGIFEEREAELRRVFEDYPMNKLVLLDSEIINSEEECDVFHERSIMNGYEGTIVRLPGEYKVAGRSNDLIKRKDFVDAEFEIIGYELSDKGAFFGLPKVLLIMDGDRVGKATKDGTREELQEIFDNFDEKYMGKMVTVEYFGRTPDGVMRHPNAKAIHVDPRW